MNKNINDNGIQWQFYLKSSDAWDAMLTDCQNAKESIDIEQYIFEYDEVGKKFAEVFKKKIKEGVRVRMILDMVGSHNFFSSKESRILMQSGVEIMWHNIINPWRLQNFSSWFFRDHRKILITDSKIGHIGGVGVDVKMADWRDTHIRMMGKILWELQDAFNLMWEMKEVGKFLRTRISRYFSGKFKILTNSPRFHQRFLYHSLIDNIRNAKSRIYLTAPYFIPDLRLFRVLRLAAKRGVDVRIIVPDKLDHPFLYSAASSYFSLLLKQGVKIFLYKKYFLHAKTAIVDDFWFSVGSANLDNLSLLFNYEICLVSFDIFFGRQLMEHFNNDIAECSELTLSNWKKRPYISKIKELATWPLHKFL